MGQWDGWGGSSQGPPRWGPPASNSHPHAATGHRAPAPPVHHHSSNGHYQPQPVHRPPSAPSHQPNNAPRNPAPWTSSETELLKKLTASRTPRQELWNVWARTEFRGRTGEELKRRYEDSLAAAPAPPAPPAPAAMAAPETTRPQGQADVDGEAWSMDTFLGQPGGSNGISRPSQPTFKSGLMSQLPGLKPLNGTLGAPTSAQPPRKPTLALQLPGLRATSVQPSPQPEPKRMVELSSSAKEAKKDVVMHDGDEPESETNSRPHTPAPGRTDTPPSALDATAPLSGAVWTKDEIRLLRSLLGKGAKKPVPGWTDLATNHFPNRKPKSIQKKWDALLAKEEANARDPRAAEKGKARANVPAPFTSKDKEDREKKADKPKKKALPVIADSSSESSDEDSSSDSASASESESEEEEGRGGGRFSSVIPWTPADDKLIISLIGPDAPKPHMTCPKMIEKHFSNRTLRSLQWHITKYIKPQIAAMRSELPKSQPHERKGKGKEKEKEKDRRASGSSSHATASTSTSSRRLATKRVAEDSESADERERPKDKKKSKLSVEATSNDKHRPRSKSLGQSTTSLPSSKDSARQSGLSASLPASHGNRGNAATSVAQSSTSALAGAKPRVKESQSPALQTAKQERTPAPFVAVKEEEADISDPASFILGQLESFKESFAEQQRLLLLDAYKSISAALAPVDGQVDEALMAHLSSAPERWNRARADLEGDCETRKKQIRDSMLSAIEEWMATPTIKTEVDGSA